MEIINFDKNDQKYQLLKRTIAKDLTDEEFELFAYICKCTKLDPFIKQIYPMKRKVKNKYGSYTEVMTIMTGIDGLRTIAERTRNYSPGKETFFHYNNDGKLLSATVYVKKRTEDGVWHETSATAIFSEYQQDSFIWKEKPHVMIAKCAESLAIRRAFPSDTANLYTAEEMGMESSLEDTTIKENGNDVLSVHSDKEIDCRANEGPCEASQEGSLESELIKEGIAIDRLDEWLHQRAKNVNKTVEKVRGNVQLPHRLPLFKEAFMKWLQEPQSAAS